MTDLGRAIAAASRKEVKTKAPIKTPNPRGLVDWRKPSPIDADTAEAGRVVGAWFGVTRRRPAGR